MCNLPDLLVDTDEVGRNLLHDTLNPYLRIVRQTGELYFLGPWDTVPNEAKVLLYLLARQAMVFLAVRDQVATTPKDIEHDTGLPGGSIRPVLKNLLRSNLLVQRNIGQYEIPTCNLVRAQGHITQKIATQPRTRAA